MLRFEIRAVLLGLVALSACQKPIGQGPCDAPSDCESDVCVEIARQSFCTQPCGTCPDEMYCDGVMFASSGVAVCLAGLVPASPTMPPRLLCAADADCPKTMRCIGEGEERQCAAECARDEDCEPLTVGGQTFAYLACTTEAEDPTRRGCVPRPECRANLLVCVFEPEPIPAAEFAELLEALEKASGLEERAMVVLAPVVEKSYFTTDQLIEVMAVFKKAGDENIIPVRSMGPKLVEKYGAERVLFMIEPADDKDEARKILGLNGD